jgi:Zn-dependent peptidase ImmA (M78 family)
MGSTSKGDKLEEAFYRYLMEQKERGELVFGAYASQNCIIYKKKQYFSRVRNSYVEFDVVIEVFRTDGKSPHLYVIFECKNHGGNVSDIYVNDLSMKMGQIFPDSSKGIMVVTSRLQSGAENVARSRGIGIVKFDENGLDVVAERKISFLNARFVKRQMLINAVGTKSLKFSAFYGGRYLSSISELLARLVLDDREIASQIGDSGHRVPFLTLDKIRSIAEQCLTDVGYTNGAVDLEAVCRSLSIDIFYVDRDVVDVDGVPILGSANFNQRTIYINSHSRATRERFTLAHEIGHFVLGHETYLRSETIVERDLLISNEFELSESYERLEYQANNFASELMMPHNLFLQKTAEIRRDLNIKDRGHGYVYVDDQPWNIVSYNDLLSRLANYFEVSKQAIEVKFRKLQLLTDDRTGGATGAKSIQFRNLVPPPKNGA